MAMQVCWYRRGGRAAWREICRSRWLFAAAGALALSACTTDGQQSALNAEPRGASVAFESIDGPPQGQFYKLVQDLNNEAQLRRLPVISRDSQAAYRVRGYLAAETVKGATTISWIWDVFDNDGHRALRISGTEAAPGKHRDAWAAADDAVLLRIARASMDQLGTFLTSPEVAPVETASMTVADDRPSSPEAAGIFRIFRAAADPVPGQTAAAPDAEALPSSVPLPRRRPTTTAALFTRETVSLAAAER
jgi:hypothetical protein